MQQGSRKCIVQKCRQCKMGKSKHLKVTGVFRRRRQYQVIMDPTIYIGLLGCLENTFIQENKLSLQIKSFSSFGSTDPDKTISSRKTGFFLLEN